MSELPIPMLELIKNNNIYKYCNTLFQIFDGHEREWAIRDSEGYFTKRFRPTKALQLASLITAITAGNKKYELHMSIQRFSEKGNMIDWTFIVDLDGDFVDRKRYALKLKTLFDNYKLFYLVDNRLHFWFPDWEHVGIKEWNNYFGDEDFWLSMKYYLESVCRMQKFCSIDQQLWNTNRHLIRAPYSLHLETMTRQEFIGINESELFDLWLGKGNMLKRTTYYAENFENFIHQSLEYGKELVISMEENPTPIKEINPSIQVKYRWIEKLLKTPVPRGWRGILLWLVITPYLVNVKKYPLQEAHKIAKSWVDKSFGDKILDNDLYNYVRSTYHHFASRGLLPCSPITLSKKFPELYKYLKSKKVF